MKSAAVFLALVATASAFNAPMMATRAVGKAAPAASKSAPPASKGYPSISDAAQKVKFGSISGGGNKAPTPFFAEAAKTRSKQAFRGITGEYVYDDGLTELE